MGAHIKTFDEFFREHYLKHGFISSREVALLSWNSGAVAMLESLIDQGFINGTYANDARQQTQHIVAAAAIGRSKEE